MAANQSMNAECVVCYVADKDFLLPSLTSAMSIRRFVSSEKAEVLIFAVGVDESDTSRANDLMATQGIRLKTIDIGVFNSIDQSRLARTYTPLATFGRLFMEEFLPATCRRIVYLDGDVWAVRDPSALIETEVPPGRFAAADDTVFLRQLVGYGATAKRMRAYFARLGLSSQSAYFNAGVFAASRQTWRTIAREAYDFFLRYTDLCTNFDQSALNAVVADRRLRLSSKWNFQTQHKIWRVDRYVEPHICHFNRYPKPWMGACDPWADMYPKYQTAIASLKALNLPLRTLSGEEVRAFNFATRKSYNYLKWPFVSSLALRLMKFKNIEQSAWL
jgi:lipopolysaccharide biosynthesis glycosyltransferase